jgi:hypothetical protein
MLRNVAMLFLCVVIAEDLEMIKGASAFSASVAGALIGMGALKVGKTLCQVSLFVLTGVLAQRE